MNQAEFLNRVVKKVRFLPDRPDIREELTGHLLDSRDWLMETEGLDEETALAQAIARMGDPDALGRELNHAHNPFLGWLWWLSQLVCVLTCCTLGLLLAFSLVAGGLGTIYNLANYSTPGDEVQQLMPVHEKLTLGPHRAEIRAVGWTKDGEIYLSYRTWTLGRHSWKLSSPQVQFADKEGPHGGSGSAASSLFMSVGAYTYEATDRGAQTLIIGWPDWNGAQGPTTVTVELPAWKEGAA